MNKPVLYKVNIEFLKNLKKAGRSFKSLSVLCVEK
jgi:hypothetical protein